MNEKIKVIVVCCVLTMFMIFYIVFSIGSISNEQDISIDSLNSLGAQINESVYYEDLEKGLLDSSCEDGLYILRSESGYTWTIKTDTNDTVQYVLRVRS